MNDFDATVTQQMPSASLPPPVTRTLSLPELISAAPDAFAAHGERAAVRSLRDENARLAQACYRWRMVAAGSTGALISFVTIALAAGLGLLDAVQW